MKSKKLKKARILIDCSVMKNKNTGLFNYCKNLCEGLMIVDGINSDFIINFYVPNKDVALLFPKAFVRRKRKWHKFLKPILFKKFDLFHIPFQNSKFLFYSSSKSKVITTIHDLNYLHEDISETKKRGFAFQINKLLRKTDKVVCISNFSKNDVVRSLDFPESKIEVIYNGANNYADCNVISDFPNTYKPEKEFLFTIGYVNPKKNFHVLLPLLQVVDAELIICGHIDNQAYLENIIEYSKKLGVSDRVKVIGPISENDKIWYYKNCKAFLFPSLAEGFGLPVIEAMHFGKPIFISKRTSLPEIGGEWVFYFDSFDPENMQSVFISEMNKYYINKEYFDRESKEWANKFDWKHQIKKYIEVYYDVLNEHH